MNIVIVLGRKLTPNGNPSKILKTRMNTAINKFKSLKYPKIMILSGGIPEEYQIRSQNFPTEAEMMLELALQKGIPMENIILEPDSSTTEENMINTNKIIENLSKRNIRIGKIYLVTSDFHMKRSNIFAKKYIKKLNLLIPVVSKYNKEFEREKETYLISEL